MVKSRDRYVRGQRQMTRSAKLLDNVEKKIQETMAKYRRIHGALESLAPNVFNMDWERTL